MGDVDRISRVLLRSRITRLEEYVFNNNKLAAEEYKKAKKIEARYAPYLMISGLIIVVIIGIHWCLVYPDHPSYIKKLFSE